MSPESKYPFSVQLDFESKVTINKDGVRPASFLFGEEMVNIIHIIRMRTELRPSPKKVHKDEIDVLTHKGQFRLIRDNVLNNWTVVGKLKE